MKRTSTLAIENVNYTWFTRAAGAVLLAPKVIVARYGPLLLLLLICIGLWASNSSYSLEACDSMDSTKLAKELFPDYGLQGRHRNDRAQCSRCDLLHGLDTRAIS